MTTQQKEFDQFRIGAFLAENLSPRQISILKSLEPFFTNEIITTILIPLICQTSNISLRALDWLVTNYSKKYNIICKTKDGKLFNIYHGYKLALSHYRRKNFDPFRRRVRIKLEAGDQTCETTVGQCNFLYWAFTNGVFQYACDNSESIEKDMNHAAAANKIDKKNKKMKGLPYKRGELSSAPASKCSIYNTNDSISFDINDPDNF